MKRFVYIIFFLIIFSCSQNQHNYPSVINYSIQENRDKFIKMNLDSIYINLAGSERDEIEADTFYSRWLAFNKSLANIVESNRFDWGTEDSSVIIWNRVYCDGNGNVEYYLYNILDSSISSEVKSAFGVLMEKELPNLKYNIQKDRKYAQCGTYRHYVY